MVSDSTSAHGRALRILETHGIDLTNEGNLEKKWTVVHRSHSKNSAGIRTERVLYQCRCGYDTRTRELKERKPLVSSDTHIEAPSKAPWQRRAPYDFTGCHAHIEVTFIASPLQVFRIIGILVHNDECQNTVMTRLPAVPLHEHVYEVAVQQLMDGARISNIKQKNLEMINACSYRGMDNPTTSRNYRYLLLTTDSSQLYQQYSSTLGVRTSTPPEHNVHNWISVESPEYKIDIAAAVFHYQPRTKDNDRLIVCIATPEMVAATWALAHHKQLVFDGTFGVCSSRLLLFIAMGVDKEGKGVPLALFLFSAPGGNAASHAGYNTEILTSLLAGWRDYLSKDSPEPFEPYIAITDSDTRERAALVTTFPSITLLLCRFHLRQSWTNQRKQILKKVKNSYWHSQAVTLIRELEQQLIHTSDFSAAKQLPEDQRIQATALLVQPDHVAQSRAILKHIDYLHKTWMSEPLWKSWSTYGRLEASARLGISVDGVLPTTNHLESFNGILKRKHILQWERSGRRLRFDFFIFLLVNRIMPEIFSQQRAKESYVEWLSDRFADAAGGARLTRNMHVDAAPRHSVPGISLAWWSPDTKRDSLAQALFELHPPRVIIHKPYDQPTITSHCLSSRNNPGDANQLIYHLMIHVSGWATCTCLDFTVTRSGACKHLRALRLLVEDWCRQRVITQTFQFPRTWEAAQKVHLTNCEAFGNNYHQVALGSMHQAGLPSLNPRDPIASIAELDFLAEPNSAELEGDASIGTLDDSQGESEDGELLVEAEEALNPCEAMEPNLEPSISSDTILPEPLAPKTHQTFSDPLSGAIDPPPPATSSSGSSIAEKNRSAIRHQVVAKTNHVLTQAQRNLTELSGLLDELGQDMSNIQDLPRFKDSLSAILLQLNNASQTQPVPEQSQNSDVLALSPQLASAESSKKISRSTLLGKRKNQDTVLRDIRPPSPEKRKQHRHDSHGVF
ncbi:hypothetical protein SISSUDRAFT_1037372 [Sistotremastrum suecicum HHB10207 ss-3]|uniref:SWIM-type domain-containing protein n=1 Tax=Sistotremastrum suecicum HHB10207 ss-3 TaxID=1314776 RepID=A0A165Y7T2_9AGAM|nr:hypothetical protein SISSUDRAFT_1037372 [Sistotremastrum suecicum HHB10207 ss-3]